MINYDSDADSDLLTVTAKPKDQKQEEKAQHKQNHRNNRAAEKYEKMMKER